MKGFYLIIFVVLFALIGCKKNDGPRLSGIDIIDNTLHGTGPYYANGFSFTSGKKLSTLNIPPPDITIEADIAVDGSIRNLYFSTNNFDNSFYLYGVYTDATQASQVFKSLTTFSITQWNPLGNNVIANQIWIFKTDIGTYAKFRIISTVGEMRNSIPFVECTFEWVYQPDGSLTFPGK
jgi:hypothetical protein